MAVKIDKTPWWRSATSQIVAAIASIGALVFIAYQVSQIAGTA